MGMFHCVEATLRCENCGHQVDSFQSKDESAGPLLCETVAAKDVNNFYTGCDFCGAWLEYDRIPGGLPSLRMENVFRCTVEPRQWRDRSTMPLWQRLWLTVIRAR